MNFDTLRQRREFGSEREREQWHALLDVVEAARQRVAISANDTRPHHTHYVLAAALARLDRLAAPHTKETENG